ncbi:transcription factor TFIIIB component B'' homolog [Trichosurus vulpecula]|uniref:transcription factor TFIIIB component B'' homolog n=1 Tax=Trichosurus vulpecula TaxID=9337 RepID=UPI00186AF0E4|nr:transcription factor TFIIIB component B'' homolog [Trichosurus vulpecula]
MFRRARLSVKPNVRPGAGGRGPAAPEPPRGHQPPREPEPAAPPPPPAPEAAETPPGPPLDPEGAKPLEDQAAECGDETPAGDDAGQSSKSSSTVSQRRKRISTVPSLNKSSAPASSVPQSLCSVQQEAPQPSPLPVKEKQPCSDRHRILKAQKLREMLREEMTKRRKQGKNKYAGNESQMPPDRSKMTMRDLIYYLPDSNPMKSSLEQEAKTEKSTPPVQTKDQEEKNIPDAEDDVEEMEEESNDGPLLVPRVKVAEDGSIILDEESLTVEVLRTKGPCVVEENDPIFERGSTTTYSSFRKNYYSKPWSNKETDMFFLAISMVGTDFSMIGQLFPHRARIEIKNKFKREEKANGWRIDKAFQEKRPFDFDFFARLLEKVLAEEEKRKQKTVKSQNTKEKKSSRPRKKQNVNRVASGEVDDDPDDSLNARISDMERTEMDAQIVEKENDQSLNVAGQTILESVVNRKKRKRKKKDDTDEQEAQNLSKQATDPSDTSKGEKPNKKKCQLLVTVINGDECNKDLEVSNLENLDEVACALPSENDENETEYISSASNQDDNAMSVGAVESSEPEALDLSPSEAKSKESTQIAQVDSNVGGKVSDTNIKLLEAEKSDTSKPKVRGRPLRPKPNLLGSFGKKAEPTENKIEVESKNSFPELPGNVEKNLVEKDECSPPDITGKEVTETESQGPEGESHEKHGLQETNKTTTFRPPRLMRGRMQRPKPRIGRTIGQKEVLATEDKTGTKEEEENESSVTKGAQVQTEDQSFSKLDVGNSSSQSEKEDVISQKSKTDEPETVEENQSLQDGNKSNTLKRGPVMRTRFQKPRPNIGRATGRGEISTGEKASKEISVTGKVEAGLLQTDGEFSSLPLPDIINCGAPPSVEAVEKEAPSQKGISSPIIPLKPSCISPVEGCEEDKETQSATDLEQVSDVIKSKCSQDEKLCVVKKTPFVRSRFKRPRPNLGRAVEKSGVPGAEKCELIEKMETGKLEIMIQHKQDAISPPQTDAFLLQENASSLQVNFSLCQDDASPPQVTASSPQVDASSPKDDSIPPQGDSLPPQVSTSSSQLDAFPPQDSASTPQINAFPLQDDISPLQGNASPLQGHASPLQGHASPLQGHASPLQGHASPLQGHASPLQGHASPLQGHASPLQGHASPLQGHASPLQGHASPLQGHASPLQGHASPLQGHASTLPGKAFALQGEAISFQGEASSLQGAAFSPQNDASPLQGSVSSLQVSVSPLQGKASPLQNKASLLQDNASPLQGEVFPLQGSASSLQGDVSSLQNSVSPLQGDASPLQDEASTLQSDASPLQSDASPLQGNASPLQGEAFPLQGGASSFQEDASPLKGNASSLQDEASSLQDDVSPLHGEASPLKGEASLRQGDVSPLQGDVSPLQGDVSPLPGEASPLQDEASPLKDNASFLQGSAFPIQDEACQLQDDVSPLQGDVSPLQSEVSPLPGEASSLQDEASPLKDNASFLQGNAFPIQDEASQFQGDVSPLQGDVSSQDCTSPPQVGAFPVKAYASPPQLAASSLQVVGSLHQDDASIPQDDAFPRQMSALPTQDDASPFQIDVSPLQVDVSPVQVVASSLQVSASSTVAVTFSSEDDASPVQVTASCPQGAALSIQDIGDPCQNDTVECSQKTAVKYEKPVPEKGEAELLSNEQTAEKLLDSMNCEPEERPSFIEAQENDFALSTCLKNSQQEIKKNGIQPAQRMRGRFKRPRPNISKAERRGSRITGKWVIEEREEGVTQHKNESESEFFTLPNSKIESEVVPSEVYSTCGNKNQGISEQNLQSSRTEVLNEQISTDKYKPCAISPAQLRRSRFQTAKPNLGKVYRKKEEPGAEEIVPNKNDTRKVEDQLLQQGDSDTHQSLKDKTELLSSLGIAARKECVDSRDSALLKEYSQSEKLDSFDRRLDDAGHSGPGATSSSVGVEEQFLNKSTRYIQQSKEPSCLKNTLGRRIVTSSTSECEMDNADRRMQRKSKQNFTKGRGSKRVRGRISKKEPKTSKAVLVTLRASQEEDEEDIEDLESEYEEENYHLAPEEVNKAPVFVPIGLRSPEPVPAQIEETMEELEISVNVPDVPCITIAEHLLPDVNVSNEGLNQEQNLNASVEITTIEYPEEETGINDGSTEAAIALLTMGNQMLQSETSTEGIVCVLPEDDLRSHISTSNPETFDHRVVLEHQVLSSPVPSTLLTTLDENKSILEEQNAGKEMNVPGQIKENSTPSSDQSSKKTTSLRTRSRFPKPKPNLSKILGKDRHVRRKVTSLPSTVDQQVDIQSDETGCIASKVPVLEDINIESKIMADGMMQASMLTDLHSFEGTDNGKEVKQIEREENQDKESQESQMVSSCPLAKTSSDDIGCNLTKTPTGEFLNHDDSGQNLLMTHFAQQCTLNNAAEVEQQNAVIPDNTAVNLAADEHQGEEEEQTFILTLVEIPRDSAEQFAGLSDSLTSGALLPAPILVKPMNKEERGDLSLNFPVGEDAIHLPSYGNSMQPSSEKPPSDLDLTFSETVGCSPEESTSLVASTNLSVSTLGEDCQKITSEVFSEESTDVYKHATGESYEKQTVVPILGSTCTIAEPPKIEKEQSEPTVQASGTESSEEVTCAQKEENVPHLPQDETVVSDEPERSGTAHQLGRRSKSSSLFSRPGRRPLGFLSLICSKNNLESEEATPMNSQKRLKPLIPVSRHNFRRPALLNESKRKKQDSCPLPPPSAESHSEASTVSSSTPQVSCDQSFEEEKCKSDQKMETEEEPTKVTEYFFSDIFMEVDETEQN